MKRSNSTASMAVAPPNSHRSYSTPEDIRLHLEGCADEDPGDGSLLRAALHDIARAGNMSQLAHETGMSRKGLCKASSEDGSPTLATVMRITRASGMKVRTTA